MICPVDSMQMHQKARVGDGESNDVRYSTWSLLECPLCHRMVVEFHSAVVVESIEDARMVGAMLIGAAAGAKV